MLKALTLLMITALLTPSVPALAAVADRFGEIEGDWIDEDFGNFEGLVDDVIYQGTPVSNDELVARATYQIEMRLPEAPDLYRPYCTGTMIAKDVMLTAGHCLSNRTDVQLFVRYGGGKRVKAVEIVRHPKYYDATTPDLFDRTRHDIAILRLAKPIPGAVPALLPKDDLRLKDSQKVMSAGFGMNGRPLSLQELMRFPDIKKLIDSGALVVPATAEAQADFAEKLSTMASVLPLLKTEATVRMGGEKIDPQNARMILASRQSLCHGDSGGPSFLKQSSGKLVIVGVHSSGTNTNCGRNKVFIFDRAEKSFDVYVPEYMNWIRSTLQGMNAIEL